MNVGVPPFPCLDGARAEQAAWPGWLMLGADQLLSRQEANREEVPYG